MYDNDYFGYKSNKKHLFREIERGVVKSTNAFCHRSYVNINKM